MVQRLKGTRKQRAGTKPPKGHIETNRVTKKPIRPRQTPSVRRNVSLRSAAARGDMQGIERHLARGANINGRSRTHGYRPVHMALISDHRDAAEMLLKRGANPRLKDNRGRTSLHHSAMRGNAEMITQLLKKKHGINEKDSFGWTPLHYAVVSGNARVVKMLLDARADPTIKNGGGMTAKEQAVKNGHQDLVELMRNTAKPHGPRTGYM